MRNLSSVYETELEAINDPVEGSRARPKAFVNEARTTKLVEMTDTRI